jgi:Holliday junction resolvasome RuvABC endonuclease subunit
MVMISIDPGTVCTGFAVWFICPLSFLLLRVVAYTYKPSSSDVGIGWGESLGSRCGKILRVGSELLRLLHSNRADVVIAEAPFVNPNRVNAYIALCELRYELRNVVGSVGVPFGTYEPRQVKKNLGVTRMGDKECVKEMLHKIEEVSSLIDLNVLDEHSIDALAVGYFHLCKLRLINGV